MTYTQAHNHRLEQYKAGIFSKEEFDHIIICLQRIRDTNTVTKANKIFKGLIK